MVSGLGLSDYLKRLIPILEAAVSSSVLSSSYYGVSSSWCTPSLDIAIIMEVNVFFFLVQSQKENIFYYHFQILIKESLIYVFIIKFQCSKIRTMRCLEAIHLSPNYVHNIPSYDTAKQQPHDFHYFAALLVSVGVRVRLFIALPCCSSLVALGLGIESYFY